MFFNSALKARIEELEASNAQHIRNNDVLLDRIDRLKEKLRKADMTIEADRARRSAVKVKRMVGLKFRALFNGVYAPTEFKTGLGPCGKNVTHFTTSRTERTLTIHQHHTDETSKDFEYRLSDIDGRIEFQFQNVQVYGDEAERERALQAMVRIRPRY